MLGPVGLFPLFPPPWGLALPLEMPLSKRPDAGVTSAASWRSVPLDTLLALVTLSLLGSEPDSAYPLSWICARLGGARESRRGLASPLHDGTSLLFSCG